MRLLSLTALTAAVTLLAGCTLEPAYHRPSSGVDAAYPRSAGAGRPQAGSTPAADIGWRDFFTDPQLRRLIAIALKHNRDLRVSTLDIAQARAQYRIQRSDLFPSIDATASDTVQRYPSGVRSSSGGGGGSATGGSTGTGSPTRFYTVGIGFTSYELDLFGRIRSLDHQALEQYFSQIETQRSAKISLVAEVANSYMTLLADSALLKLARDTENSQQRSYALTQQSYQLGAATALDLSQAEQAVDTAQADIARYRRQVAQDRNALRLLLGAPLPKHLATDGRLDQQHLLESLPAGLPSDLLTRRPDVVAAEHALKAANANIGAARAAFFPSISLTGNFGTASSKLNGLFGDGSQAWTFAPQISLPIFAGGANTANLDLAHVEKNIQIAHYQKTVQTAFREVADALAARGALDRQLAADQRLLDATQTSYRLSDMRFRQGVDSYLSVLVAQRARYSAQQTAISVQLSRLQNLVTLYKALGGGWTADTVKRAAPASTDHGSSSH